MSTTKNFLDLSQDEITLVIHSLEADARAREDDQALTALKGTCTTLWKNEDLSPVSRYSVCKGRSRSIYGIGRNYNRELGVGAFRTGAAIRLNTTREALLATVKRNIEEAAKDPQATVRLMVQGNQFWFSEAVASEIFARTVMEGNADDAKAERLRSEYNATTPASVCVIEEFGESDCLATWLFRHDVIDGWRCLRYLTPLTLETTDLTMSRLMSRAAKPPQKTGGLERALALCLAGSNKVVQAAAPIALAPAAVGRIAQLAMPPPPCDEKHKFYAHIVCDLPALKRMGREKGLGSLNTTLTACVTEAFFAADPEASSALVGANMLFDADATDGNHMCLKAVRHRRGATMQAMAQKEAAQSQKLADAWVGAVSRKYALGQLNAG
eukprot:4580557-Prymnesium_polylepis.1